MRPMKILSRASSSSTSNHWQVHTCCRLQKPDNDYRKSHNHLLTEIMYQKFSLQFYVQQLCDSKSALHLSIAMGLLIYRSILQEVDERLHFQVNLTISLGLKP